MLLKVSSAIERAVPMRGWSPEDRDLKAGSADEIIVLCEEVDSDCSPVAEA